jgi:hypothetical protein
VSVRNFGNPPIFSTSASNVSNPSTATIVGEIIFSTTVFTQPDIYEVRWGVGASTSCIWLLEHCVSSGLGSTAITRQITVMTGTNQTSEFVFTHVINPGERLRARVLSTFTGTAAAPIQAEAVT